MKRPERPETLFAVLVAVAALLLTGGTAQAATTANGSAVSADAKAAERKQAEKKAADKDDADPASIRDQLKRLAEEYKKSQDRLDALDHQQQKVGRKVSATKKRLRASRDRVGRTAQLAYTNGPSNDPLIAMASNDDPTLVAKRMTTLSLLSRSDNNAIRTATTEAEKLGNQQAKLRKAKKGAAKEKAALAKKRKKLNAKLLEAARELAARKNDQAASRAKMSSQGACPVGEPVQISDTWGAARSGGRAHEGTDMLAPTGTPTYAIESGTISEAGYDGLGGTIVILKADSGDSYYYAHHDTNTVSTGERVVAGQQVGTVGMSGNAQGTVPHLHFEHWPGGGNPVNPYPLVQALCG